MPEGRRAGGRTGVVVLRSGVGAAAVAAAGLAALALVAQALVLGRADTVGDAGPWLLAGLWLMVLLLARPRVVIAPEGAEVVGVLRRHHLPWGAVRSASFQPHARFALHEGRTVTGWDGSRRQVDGALGALVAQRIDAHDGDGARASSRWDRAALGVTAALGLLCALSVLL